MFGFGAEVATIAAVMQGLKSLNSALATVKEAGANASALGGLVTRYSDLENKVREVEQKKAGVLSLNDSMNLQLARRQLEQFHQQLKDSLILSGQSDQYRQIMARIEESKQQHQASINALKRKRRERQKLMKEVATYVTIGASVVTLAIGGLWLFVQFFK